MDKPYVEKLFAYAHLPLHLQTTSKTFHSVAMYIIDGLPQNAERTVALRKLLEAKDAAVRCDVIGPNYREL